jgi:hypothetical protein
MAVNFDIKKYSLAEVVLLAIFALGLLISHLIVTVRSRIELSEPFRLNFANLSVSLPEGRGWQESQGWQFQTDNYFLIITPFNITGKLDRFVRCRYFVAAEDTEAQEHLERSLAELGGQVEELGVTEGSLQFHWAYVPVSRQGGVLFVGCAKLQGNRLLEVEAMDMTDGQAARKLFNKVIESIEYTPDDNLQKGQEFISKLKETGAEALLKTELGENDRRIYVIADNDGMVDGFIVDTVKKIVKTASIALCGTADTVKPVCVISPISKQGYSNQVL